MLCLLGNSRWKQVDRTHLIESLTDILSQILININPIIVLEDFRFEMWILRCTRSVHFHFNLVARSFRGAATADRGFCNKTGTQFTGDRKRKSSEGLENGGLPSACITNNYNLEIQVSNGIRQ